jgi:hypothetical protein
MLGLLHACTAYHPAPIDPEYSANQFAARRLEDPRLRTDVANLMPQADSSWPPQQWDRGELLAIAMARNSELVVARAQLQSARAQEVTARQWLNPDMTLQSEYGARGEPHPWLYGVAFDYVLQSPARRRLEQHVAGLAVETARLQLMDRIWSLRRELVTALSDWESAKRVGRTGADPDGAAAGSEPAGCERGTGRGGQGTGSSPCGPGWGKA